LTAERFILYSNALAHVVVLRLGTAALRQRNLRAVDDAVIFCEAGAALHNNKKV
jgi:hypothetical protein